MKKSVLFLLRFWANKIFSPDNFHQNMSEQDLDLQQLQQKRLAELQQQLQVRWDIRQNISLVADKPITSDKNNVRTVFQDQPIKFFTLFGFNDVVIGGYQLK